MEEEESSVSAAMSEADSGEESLSSSSSSSSHDSETGDSNAEENKDGDEAAARDPGVGGWHPDDCIPHRVTDLEQRYVPHFTREVLDVSIELASSLANFDSDLDANGEGSAELANGCRYKGMWVSGLPHGQGTLLWPDGTRYTGDMTHGEVTGEGEYQWKNGGVYRGSVVCGKRHGYGVYTNSSPRYVRYEGWWASGARHGRGKMCFDEAALSYYDGEWVCGKRCGVGMCVYRDTSVYVGEWRGDKRNGRGRFALRGDVYDGDWVDGFREGSGEQCWEQQGAAPGQWLCVNRYQGSWKRGLREGQGCFEYADGSMYRGEWSAGQKQGAGVFVHADGRVDAGYFVQDRMTGSPVEEKAAVVRVSRPDGVGYDDVEANSDSIKRGGEVLEQEDTTVDMGSSTARGTFRRSSSRRGLLQKGGDGSRDEEVSHQRAVANTHFLHLQDLVADEKDEGAASLARVRVLVMQHMHDLRTCFLSFSSSEPPRSPLSQFNFPLGARPLQQGVLTSPATACASSKLGNISPFASELQDGDPCLEQPHDASSLTAVASPSRQHSSPHRSPIASQCTFGRGGAEASHPQARQQQQQQQAEDGAMGQTYSPQPSRSSSSSYTLSCGEMCTLVREARLMDVRVIAATVAEQVDMIAHRIRAWKWGAGAALEGLTTHQWGEHVGREADLSFRQYVECVVRVGSLRFVELETLQERVEKTLRDHIAPLAKLLRKRPSIPSHNSGLRAYILERNFERFRQSFAELSKGKTTVTLREVCGLLLSRGVIGVAGGSKIVTLGDVVRKFLSVELNMEEEDDYIAQNNGTNLDVMLVFDQFVAGIVRLAQDYQPGNQAASDDGGDIEGNVEEFVVRVLG